MKNEYEIRGEEVAIYLYREKFGQMETIISKSKLERAKEFPNLWSLMRDIGTGYYYVCGRMSIHKKQKNFMLHRWITGAEKGMQVDHFNHETLNNTDENLRVVTLAENQQNRKGATSRSATGVRGVYWHKESKRWCAQIRANGKKIDVGYFTDINHAAKAINEARKKYTPMSFDIVS